VGVKDRRPVSTMGPGVFFSQGLLFELAGIDISFDLKADCGLRARVTVFGISRRW